MEASRSAQGIMAAVCMGQQEELKQLEAVKTMAEVEVEPPKHLEAQVQLDYKLVASWARLVAKDILYPKEVESFHLQAELVEYPLWLPLMEHHPLLHHNEQPGYLVESLAFHIFQYPYSLCQVLRWVPW